MHRCLTIRASTAAADSAARVEAQQQAKQGEAQLAAAKEGQVGAAAEAAESATAALKLAWGSGLQSEVSLSLFPFSQLAIR